MDVTIMDRSARIAVDRAFPSSRQMRLTKCASLIYAQGSVATSTTIAAADPASPPRGGAAGFP
jgi:hypothetical protein